MDKAKTPPQEPIDTPHLHRRPQPGEQITVDAVEALPPAFAEDASDAEIQVAWSPRRSSNP